MAKDLAIARGSLYRAQEENKRLMIQLDRTLLAQRNDSLDQPSPTYDTLSKVEDHLVECQLVERLRLKVNCSHPFAYLSSHPLS